MSAIWADLGVEDRTRYPDGDRIAGGQKRQGRIQRVEILAELALANPLAKERLDSVSYPLIRRPMLWRASSPRSFRIS